MKSKKGTSFTVVQYLGRGVAGLLAGGVLAAMPLIASAQDFPNKPLKIVVGFPPGGGSDLMARSVGDRLSTVLKQPVIVENKPGAGSSIAASYVAQSKPDGYTILFAQAANLGIAPALRPNLNYDPLKSFAPITRLVSAPLVIVGPASLQAKTLQELIAMAMAKPGALSYGSPGAGTAGHLAGEMFGSEAKVKIVHVPYKGQSAAITDMIGGRIELYFSTLAVVKPHVEGGKIRAFAVTSKDRSPAFPTVPTVAEAGVKGFEIENWYGLVAPAGTPPAIINLLNKEVLKILKDPKLVEELSKEGGNIRPDTPEQFAKFLAVDVPRWKKIVTDAKLETN
jgi:tripartite-type tricarboxylate transporter receptor subunit TctC